MEIFEFNFKGEKDWVIANNITEATEIVNKQCGNDNYKESDGQVLPARQLAEMMLVDPNEPEPDDSDDDYSELYPNGHDEDDYSCGYKIVESFEELLDRTTKPKWICSSDMDF